MRVTVIGALLSLAACSGFSEVQDGGFSERLLDGARSDVGAGSAVESDGPRLPGACCAKPEDCISGMCHQEGSGPGYCDKSCTVAPDDCPVGFRCDEKTKQCYPPPIGGYQCGPQVVQAGPQPLGGCCGKLSDCLSGQCINVGEGDYFCTEACTSRPDSCKAGYLCSTAQLCAPPSDSTCSYR